MSSEELNKMSQKTRLQDLPSDEIEWKYEDMEKAILDSAELYDELLDKAYSSDALADAVITKFVEGDDGGTATAVYALRWCLLHMKRSGSDSEAGAVACSLSYVRKRSKEGTDVSALAGDLDALKSRDASLLLDALVLSRDAVKLRYEFVEQLWQRLMPRADGESSPAVEWLANDAMAVASELPLEPGGCRAPGRCPALSANGCLRMLRDDCLGHGP